MSETDVRVAYPWLSEPKGLGSAECSWCGRLIYAPALPCSVAPIRNINTIPTRAGVGNRCKWEINTRGLAAEGIDPYGL